MKPTGLLLSALLAATPALAGNDAVDPEVRRLSDEMNKLAAKNAWSGVERSYWSILDLGRLPNREQHLLAAEAARQRGDIVSLLERYEAAQAVEKSDDTQTQIDAVLNDFGRVHLDCASGAEPLTAAVVPFRPDQVASIDFAAHEMRTDGHFEGFLPTGSYDFGTLDLVVSARAEPDPLDLSGADRDIDAELLAGTAFPQRANLGGRKLYLNGMAIREKVYIDIYVVGLYVPVPTDRPEMIIERDEPKRLMLEFVYKQVTQSQLQSAFADAFDKVPNAEAVATRAALLIGWMEDMHAGQRVYFDYVPKRGTAVWVKGRRRGVIEGADFMSALMAVYVGDKPPTAKVKRGLLGK